MALQELGAGVGAWIGSLLAEGPASEEEKKVYDLLLQNMNEYGQIDPAVLKNVEAEIQTNTEFDKIREDVRLKDAQMNALQRMQQVASEGGMTAIDRARLNDINAQVNQQTQARRQAAMTQAAQRGQAGSGLMYANILGGEQAAAEAAARQGFDVAAEAQRRALEAMAGSGRLAGDIRGQEYQQAANRAQAQDRINAYNTQLRNEMNKYANTVAQQNFQNRMDVARGRTGARSGVAGYHQGRAGQIRNQYQQAGTAIGGTIGGIGDVAMNVATGGASGLVDEFGNPKKQQSGSAGSAVIGGSGPGGSLR